MIPAWLRPFLAVVGAPLLLFIAGHLELRWGIVITKETQKQILDLFLDYGLPIMAANGLLRVLLNKKVNPANAHSTGAAAEGKAKQRQRHQTRAIEDRLKEHGLEVKKEESPPEL
jgi:hypothetical protein